MLYRISVLSLAMMLAGCLSLDSAKPTVSNAPPKAEAPRLEPVPGQWEGLKKANLRSGPGTDFAVVGSIRPAQKVQVIGRVSGTDWFAIEDPAGKVPGSMVYVRSDLLFQRPTVPVSSVGPAPVTPVPVALATAKPPAIPLAVSAPAPLPATVPIPTPATAPTPVPAPPPAALPLPVAAAPAPATASSAPFAVKERARRSDELVAKCRATLPAPALSTCRELAQSVADGSDPSRSLPPAGSRQPGDFVFTGPGWRGGVLLRETNGRWQAFAANAPMSWQVRLARND